MSDLISRKALCKYALNTKDKTISPNDIMRFPSAEPELKKGEWLHKPNEYDDDTYECSRCGEPWTLIEGTPKENNMNYCPNCGAKMRGDR